MKPTPELTMPELVRRMRFYASRYNMPPYGREIEGTDELLTVAAEAIEKLSKEYIELCDSGLCGGDSSVGIPSCPFYVWPDFDGEKAVPGGCVLRQKEGVDLI